MQKTAGLFLLMIGASASCFAGLLAVPEVDPAAGGAAIALVAGALMVIRARRRK
ncbi:MAG: hypothetical protein LAO79_29255 [Acidobacteriia bacterium]|nr:hypothetical protein [Terriglobia bacterium]